jgi:hypothetical protein
MAQILSLSNWYDTFINVLFEFRNTVKSNTSLKCKVEYVYDNGHIEPYFGYTDVGNKILFVPNLLIIKGSPKPYYRQGIKTFYISADSEDCIDLNKNAKVANALNQEAIIQWKHLRTWQELKVKKIKGTIDLNLFDNKYAGDFSYKGFQILNTKVLEFLNETRRSILLLSMALSAFIGGFIISLAYLVLIIVILIILVLTNVIG